MAGMGDLTIGLGANTVSLESDFTRAERLTERMVGNINIAISKVGSGANFNGVSTQIEALKAQFSSLQGVMTGALGVGIGAAGVRQLAAVADEFQGISNRIRTTTDDTSQMLAVQKQVFDIAQQTGAAYDDSAKMYQRLEQAIEGSGKSRSEAQRQAIALSKTLNEEIVVSGASAGEASRSIMDLVHGLSGGVLHAQQLRPIMRQMPDLAKQIADGLGLSAKQFEEMVHKGLPAADVLRAIEAQAGAIDERFTALPKTFARVWQELENAVVQYVGSATQASTVSDLVKHSISGIAANIGTVATGAELVAVAMASWLGGKGLQTIGALSASIRDAALAQGSFATATIRAAESDLSAAEAQAKATAATAAMRTQAAELALTLDAEAAAATNALLAEQRLIEARLTSLPVGVNVIAESTRLEMIRAQLAVTTANEAKSETALAAALTREEIALATNTAATEAAAAAKVSLAAAQADATAATGLLTRAGSGLLALFGGVPGVFLAAGAAFAYVITRTTEVDDAVAALSKRTQELQAQNGDFYQSLIQIARGQEIHRQSLLEVKEAQLAQAMEQQKVVDQLPGYVDEMGGASLATDTLRLEVVRLREAQAGFTLATINSEIQGFVRLARGAVDAALNWRQNIVDAAAGGTDALDKEAAAYEKHAASVGKSKTQIVEWEKAQKLATDAKKLGLTEGTEAYALLTSEMDKNYARILAAAKADDLATSAVKGRSAATREAKKIDEESAKGLEQLTNTVNSLSGKTGGEYTKAWASYAAEITKLDEEYARAIASGKSFAQAQALLANGVSFARAKLDASTESIRDQSDASQILSRVLIEANRQSNEQIRLSGLDSTARAIAVETIRLQTEAENALKDTMGPLTEEQQRQIEQLPRLAAKQVLFNDTMERSKQVAQEWQSIWVQAGNSVAETFSKVLVEGGSLLDGLKDIAKQVVESIIAQFIKLRVINPILNSVFGGQQGWSGLSTGGGGLMQAGMGLVTGGGGITSTGLLNFTSDASGASSGGSLFSGASWIQAGKNIYSGFQTAWLGSGQTSWAGSLMGTSQFGPGMGTTWTPSGFGAGVGIAAGAYAGYNRWQGSNHDLGGGLGAAAYGIGTVGAIGAAGGILGGAGAAAGMAGGMSSIGLAAIPVVGWIALAAMAIDMISGGKLFGTGKEMKGGWAEMGITASGSSAQNIIDYKGQSAFFGGAEYSQEHTAASAEQLAAAKTFFDAVKKGSDDFAKQFGLAAGEVASGIFSQKFDKKGNPTGETITHINGLDYKNETQQQFAERIQAESFSATLLKIGLDITTYTHQYIASADAYAQAVQDSAAVAQAAQADISSGVVFMATGTDQTISAIFKLAEGAITGGESIAQAFQRIEQAQIQYTQFVGQFKPAATFVDDFEAALSNVNTTLLANIKQANDLARAAGAEGAATKDLVNIHAAAAKQMADLITALEASTQSLAYSMGLTQAGTLDQINARIQQLEGNADGAASSVGSFGDAMQQASQRASDAINLLLGDLSPLNDQQKLQTALQGLYAGTVTQDQVLQIARRLYATGQQYTDLFNTVTQVAQRATGNLANYGGGSTGAHAVNDPTGTGDHRSLAELYAERDRLTQQKDYEDAQRLAQQIAEIAMAKGEDFTEVLKEQGIKQADLEARLHLDSDAQLKAYFDNVGKQVDSNKENTSSIVNAIDRLGNRLLGLTTQPDADGRTRNGPTDPIRVDPRHNDTVIASIERTGDAVRALVDRMQQSGIGGVTAPRGGLRLPAPVR